LCYRDPMFVPIKIATKVMLVHNIWRDM